MKKIIMVLLLISFVFLGTTNVSANILDCDSKFCDGIKLLYSGGEAKKIIAYSLVGFNFFNPNFNLVLAYNGVIVPKKPVYFNNWSPYGTFKKIYMLSPQIDFAVKKGGELLHQKQVSSTALYRFDYVPKVDFDPPGDFAVYNSSGVLVSYPGARDPNDRDNFWKDGSCKITYDEYVSEEVDHFKNGEWVGSGNSVRYLVNESEVVHRTSINLTNQIFQKNYIWFEGGCFKTKCAEKINNTCVRVECDKYKWDCKLYRNALYTDHFYTYKETRTVKPIYDFVVPNLSFVEGQTNKVFIEFDKSTLGSIRFDINSFFYQEDYNKYGLEFSNPDVLITVTSHSDFRQTHTLRLVNRSTDANIVYVEFDLRNLGVEQCKITTTDDAFNVYEYECPPFEVTPQPEIILSKDKMFYHEGDTVKIEVGLNEGGEVVPGNLIVTYGDKQVDVVVSDKPVVLEFDAVEGNISVVYVGDDNFSPSKRTISVSLSEIDTGYIWTVIKYLLAVLLFLLLLGFAFKKLRGK